MPQGTNRREPSTTNTHTHTPAGRLPPARRPKKQKCSYVFNKKLVAKIRACATRGQPLERSLAEWVKEDGDAEHAGIWAARSAHLVDERKHVIVAYGNTYRPARHRWPRAIALSGL